MSEQEWFQLRDTRQNYRSSVPATKNRLQPIDMVGGKTMVKLGLEIMVMEIDCNWRNGRGYLLPQGATNLGLHLNSTKKSRICGEDFLSSLNFNELAPPPPPGTTVTCPSVSSATRLERLTYKAVEYLAT